MMEFAAAHEITSRLYELGLTGEQLVESVSKGLDARRRCTDDHPPSAPGYYHWSETHVALRQTLRPLGWEKNDDGNFSTVVSPDGWTAITIATGDARTDREGRPLPTTKYPRGAMTQVAVQTNNQLELDLDSGEIIVPSDPERPQRTTWWLLINTRHNGVWMELSRPRSLRREDNRIDSWSERIILKPLDMEPTSQIPLDEQGMPPIDIPLERR